MKRKITSKKIDSFQQKYDAFRVVFLSLLGILVYISVAIFGIHLGISSIKEGYLLFGWMIMIVIILVPLFMFLLVGVPIILIIWKDRLKEREKLCCYSCGIKLTKKNCNIFDYDMVRKYCKKCSETL